MEFFERIANRVEMALRRSIPPATFLFSVLGTAGISSSLNSSVWYIYNNMIEKKSLTPQYIIECLNTNYGIAVTTLRFLPLGADMHASVYKAETQRIGKSMGSRALRLGEEPLTPLIFLFDF